MKIDVTLARIEERMQNRHDEIKGDLCDIKTHLAKLNGKTDINTIGLAKLEQKVHDHVKDHRMSGMGTGIGAGGIVGALIVIAQYMGLI